MCLPASLPLCVSALCVRVCVCVRYIATCYTLIIHCETSWCQTTSVQMAVRQVALTHLGFAFFLTFSRLAQRTQELCLFCLFVGVSQKIPTRFTRQLDPQYRNAPLN